MVAVRGAGVGSLGRSFSHSKPFQAGGIYIQLRILEGESGTFHVAIQEIEEKEEERGMYHSFASNTEPLVGR